jgi:formate dehydrogenase maturation protein FdhE
MPIIYDTARDTSDVDYEDFRNRVDQGEQCPMCYARVISVTIDMQGSIWFRCDGCKHEWQDPWSDHV